MMLDKEFAEVVEDFMVPHDLGIRPPRPVSILERLEVPIISDLFKSLKKAPPKLASVVIDLYDFSHESLTYIAKTVEALRKEVAAGKDLKAFSILTQSGGVTYLVCREMNARIRVAAEAIGHKHKYDSKRDRWYIIVDNISTPTPVDALLPLAEKWREDTALADNSRTVDALFNTRLQTRGDPT
jgi:hypothetical protein